MNPRFRRVYQKKLRQEKKYPECKFIIGVIWYYFNKFIIVYLLVLFLCFKFFDKTNILKKGKVYSY